MNSQSKPKIVFKNLQDILKNNSYSTKRSSLQTDLLNGKQVSQHRVMKSQPRVKKLNQKESFIISSSNSKQFLDNDKKWNTSLSKHSLRSKQKFNVTNFERIGIKTQESILNLKEEQKDNHSNKQASKPIITQYQIRNQPIVNQVTEFNIKSNINSRSNNPNHTINHHNKSLYFNQVDAIFTQLQDFLRQTRQNICSEYDFLNEQNLNHTFTQELTSLSIKFREQIQKLISIKIINHQQVECQVLKPRNKYEQNSNRLRNKSKQSINKQVNKSRQTNKLKQVNRSRQNTNRSRQPKGKSQSKQNSIPCQPISPNRHQILSNKKQFISSNDRNTKNKSSKNINSSLNNSANKNTLPRQPKQPKKQPLVFSQQQLIKIQQFMLRQNTINSTINSECHQDFSYLPTQTDTQLLSMLVYKNKINNTKRKYNNTTAGINNHHNHQYENTYQPALSSCSKSGRTGKILLQEDQYSFRNSTINSGIHHHNQQHNTIKHPFSITCMAGINDHLNNKKRNKLLNNQKQKGFHKENREKSIYQIVLQQNKRSKASWLK